MVEVSYYCKCLLHDFCSLHLPNVGREGHSYLWYVAHNYDSLASTTVFINGGFESKPHAKFAVHKIFNVLISDSADVRKKGEMFYCDERETSWTDTATIFMQTQNCSVVEEYCGVDTNRCSISDLPCFGQSKCGCSPQVNCSWVGSTREKLVITGGQLESALNNVGEAHSIFSWSCDKLGISPETIEQCGYSWSAVFAVGRSRLHRLPEGLYLQLIEEFDLFGANGGVVVHYLER